MLCVSSFCNNTKKLKHYQINSIKAWINGNNTKKLKHLFCCLKSSSNRVTTQRN